MACWHETIRCQRARLALSCGPPGSSSSFSVNTSLLTIISGAQTGVDRAALDAALAHGFPCGGWVPAGRVDEDGLIPDHYPVTPLKKGGFQQRTLQNLCDADGTVIFYFGDLEGGTEQTAFRCMKVGRPYRLIDALEIPVARAVELTLDFIQTRGLSSLNVAGPRASKRPDGYAYAYAVIDGVLARLKGGR